MGNENDSSNESFGSGSKRQSRTGKQDGAPRANEPGPPADQRERVEGKGTLADGGKAHTDDSALHADSGPNTSRIPPEEGGEPEEIGLAARSEGEERVGKVLARRYRLTEFLGKGAMGEVFRAEHAFMKKTVALKILHTDVADRGKIVERFRREAQAAANIDHPNVCVATDFGRTSESEFFLVMEFLEGETLQDLVDRNGPLEVERALHIANQVVSALVRAHEVGVVHRDLKPDNIMLVERGDESDFVKVLDFGIARVRMGEETPELTKTGAVFGTPSYMSPEQAAGDPIDHRTDLYSIGSLLFEMLTGRRVFEAERGAQVMAMHVSNEPPSPSEFAPNEIAADLEALILELLEKNPDDRPQTADELHRRLLALDQVEMQPVYPGLSVREPAEADQTEDVEISAESVDRQTATGRLLASTADAFERLGAVSQWGVLALVAVGFGAAALFLALGVTNSEFDPAGVDAEAVGPSTSIVVEREAFASRPGVREALAALDRGAFRSATEQLEELKASEKPENPHLAFLLGEAYARGDRVAESLAYFAQTLRIEPKYIESRRLLRRLIEAFRADDDQTRARAKKLLAAEIDRPFVRAVVGRAAWNSSSTSIRKQALEVLDETGAYEELPEWTKRSIQLRHSSGCSEHRANIEKLAELGDPRGLEVLRIYDGFPRRGCGEAKTEDCFGCVREDLAEAIEHLRNVDG